MDDWWMYEWMNGWNEWKEWMNEWMDDPMDYFNLYVTSWSPLQERLDITQPRRLSTSFIQTSKRPMSAVGRSSFFFIFFFFGCQAIPDCCQPRSQVGLLSREELLEDGRKGKFRMTQISGVVEQIKTYYECGERFWAHLDFVRGCGPCTYPPMG